MLALATTSTADAVLPLRVRYRQEMNCQIVHDSIHRRAGWTVTYILNVDGVTAGFGSIALAGPWKDKPSIFEFYVLPEYRAPHLSCLRPCSLPATRALWRSSRATSCSR